MRWPWQRERSEPRADDAGGRLKEPVAEPPNVPPAGWAFLPPLQRTTGNIQLTADPEHFTGALAAWGDPSFTGPMTHLVSAAAPPGVIDVDGGGPVSGNAGYSPSSVEMTLLPPPAPRIRMAPDRPGSAASLQRTASDGGPSAGASLLAAEPETFPVLHVDAIPLHPPEPLPKPDVSAPSSPQADLETSAPPLSATAAESSRVTLPSQPSLPRYADGSTSDGHATYVPLPSAPAVQRASSGTTGTSRQSQQVPHPSKLGIGMPLSFSEPVTPSGPGASNGPSHPAVQRSVTSPSDYSESSGQAPVQARVQAPEPEDEPVDGTALGEGEPQSSPPAVESRAPLLSGQVPDEPADHGGPTATRQTRLANAGDATAPNLPIVSRFGPVVSGPPAVEDLGVGPDVREAPSEDLASVGSTADFSGNGVAGTQAAVMDFERPSVKTSTEVVAEPVAESAARPSLVLSPASSPVSRRGGAPAGDPAVQRDLESGSPALQSDAGNDAPAEAASGAELVAQDPGPGGRGVQSGPATTGPVDSGQSDRGSPESISSLTQPALPVQRVTQPSQRTRSMPQPLARTIPTAATPVVLRVIRTATPGTAPETWQRLTAIPAPAQSGYAEPAPIPSLASSPGGQDMPTEIGHGAIPAGPNMTMVSDAAALPPMPIGVTGAASNHGASGTHGDVGFDGDPTSGFDFDPGSGPAASAPAVDLGAGAPSRQSATVGRSIQRTVAMDGIWLSADAGPGSLSPSRWPAGSVSATNGAGPLSGGRGAGTIQRSAASSALFPRHVELAPAGAASRPVRPADTAGPGVPAATPANDYASRALVLSLATRPADQATASAVVQREVTSFAPEPQFDAPVAGVEAAAGLSTATPETATAAASVQTDAESAPAGAARQGPAASGNGPAGAPAAGAPAATPEQLDELAKRLTGPLIRRIKAEMLLDRERRGLRTDMN